MPAHTPRLLPALLLATFGLGLGAPAPARASGPAARRHGEAGSAMASFRARHDKVLAMVHKRASSRKIQAEVDQLLDYKWLAVAALGGAGRYEKRCAPRCEEFEALLTKLIRENYLKRIRMADRGDMQYTGEQRRAGAAKVNTRVVFEREGRKQKLDIAYVMHRVNGQWQVRDIITDGVSLARNYKYEFNKILREEGGIDGLIQRLETKLAQLAKSP